MTKEECSIIVSELKSNKSPGLDGISQEFYKFFWDDLSEYFMSVVTKFMIKVKCVILWKNLCCH